LGLTPANGSSPIFQSLDKSLADSNNFLFVVAIDAVNEWWYIIPVSLSVVILFLASMNYGDENFDI
ncbi:MAG: hypothetical protein K2M00_04475, partial [Muribaculaceae bacterium]|nr:hypothetical protein [Muribaculaceae bacterium]